jgi:hypothetical protein
MYALNIDGETNRILSATFDEYAPQEQPRVEALPDGNIMDSLYVDGAFVYDPLPTSEPVEPAPTVEELQRQILQMQEVVDALIGGETA